MATPSSGTPQPGRKRAATATPGVLGSPSQASAAVRRPPADSSTGPASPRGASLLTPEPAQKRRGVRRGASGGSQVADQENAGPGGTTTVFTPGTTTAHLLLQLRRDWPQQSRTQQQRSSDGAPVGVGNSNSSSSCSRSSSRSSSSNRRKTADCSRREEPLLDSEEPLLDGGGRHSALAGRVSNTSPVARGDAHSSTTSYVHDQRPPLAGAGERRRARCERGGGGGGGEKSATTSGSSSGAGSNRRGRGVGQKAATAGSGVVNGRLSASSSSSSGSSGSSGAAVRARVGVKDRAYAFADGHGKEEVVGRVGGTTGVAPAAVLGSADVQAASVVRGGPAAAGPGLEGCSCRKSLCLKLYCQCFASQLVCSDACKCENCYNSAEHGLERRAAVRELLCRSPHAFDAKFKTEVQAANGGTVTASAVVHNTGCGCSKSACLKRYCECFNGGIACSDKCRCKDCKNTVSDVVARGSRPGVAAAAGGGGVGGGREAAAILVAAVNAANAGFSASGRSRRAGGGGGGGGGGRGGERTGGKSAEGKDNMIDIGGGGCDVSPVVRSPLGVLPGFVVGNDEQSVNTRHPRV